MSTALRVIHAVHQGGDRAGVARQADALLAGEGIHADPDSAWLGLLALVYAGHLDAAEAHLAAFARDHRWSRSERHGEVIALGRAYTALLRGAAGRASELLETAVRRASSPSVLLLAVAWLIEAYVVLGETDRAQRLLVTHDLVGAVDAEEPERPHVLAARGELHLAAGRLRQGVDDYRAAGRLLTSLNVVNPAVLPWRSRVVPGALALGRVHLAVALAEDELAAARRWGSPRAVGCALHALALARRDADSVAWLEQAAGLLDEAQSRSEQVRALHDLSVVQASRGEPAAARRTLDAAVAVSSMVDNPASRLRLEAARAQLDTSDRGIRLTRQELKVARLARAGHTNKRIAEDLFLTVRTVEFHLSGVYRKLGLPGRRELVNASSALDE
ncbi:LuxR C-terminal-related transcriptional regulator [Saccharothrix saharensis]|uniref:LuxR C-terminal-related transcriptional regulator n=1 Tax=Saccharothrix saharensis TaxID=571190 RepID=UPI003694CC90